MSMLLFLAHIHLEGSSTNIFGMIYLGESLFQGIVDVFTKIPFFHKFSPHQIYLDDFD